MECRVNCIVSDCWKHGFKYFTLVVFGWHADIALNFYSFRLFLTLRLTFHSASVTLSRVTILCSTWLKVASCPRLEPCHGLVTRRNGSLGRQAGWTSQHPGSVPPEGAAGCAQPGQSSPVTQKLPPEVSGGVPVGRPRRPLDNPASRSSGPETLVPYAELLVVCQVRQAVPTEAAAFFQEAKHPLAGDCPQVWSGCLCCAERQRRSLLLRRMSEC